MIGQTSATPLLDALGAIISMCTSENNGETIMVNDASRAYFSAAAGRQVFVEPPDKDKVDGKDMRGELNYGMYGARDAAQNWGEECAATMGKTGFHRLTASPCTLGNPKRGPQC